MDGRRSSGMAFAVLIPICTLDTPGMMERKLKVRTFACVEI